MRSFTRGLSNLLTCLSLLAFGALCALWVRSEYVCDVASRTDSAGVNSTFCSAGGVLQFTRIATTPQLLQNPFTNIGGTFPAAMTISVQQPWQWLRSPPSQAASSIMHPEQGDAALGAHVVVLIARSAPVYAPSSTGGFSGFQPASPVASAAVLSIGASDWFLAAIAAALPLLRGMGWYGRRRRATLVSRGVCANCGYDLRATPGRCPECGKVPGRGKQ